MGSGKKGVGSWGRKIISARELEEGNWGYRGGAGSTEGQEGDGAGGGVWAPGAAAHPETRRQGEKRDLRNFYDFCNCLPPLI